MRIGAIEAGGTKFVCGVGNESGLMEDSISFPTGHPEETLPQVISYFKKNRVEAIGIGSFGPVGLRRDSPTYGFITTTPKPGWAQYPFLDAMRRHFGVPFGWDTDVNAAAFGEAAWGAAEGLDSCVYDRHGHRRRRICRRPTRSRPGSSGGRPCAREAPSGGFLSGRLRLPWRLPGRDGGGTGH
ncbi:hypothetical protein PAJ34TS1_11990 [Paenibacillus azoreducens]|uniref:fructokinase n=1 Tax=Paenibacillus azoreducens TaxID=116718 RepID=A0A920CRR5_9BACL|nr:hypothetical protein J34TS1_61060 [Paenibacillus azoreducens]